jgi:crotonobetaine/carnitine-CoA ligase
MTGKELTMAGLLREQAARVGDAPFLLFGDERVGFAAADRLVDAYARGVGELGVGPGSHVAIMMENGPEFLWLALALNRLGAVCVPVNTAYKSGYLRHVLAQAGAEVLVVDGPLIDRVHAVRDQLPALRHIVDDAARLPEAPNDGDSDGDERESGHDSAAVVDHPGAPGDLAMILYTSGTTGASKGAMISNKCWYDATVSTNDRRDIRDDDVFYVASPMFHAAAWVVCINSALTTGLPVAIDRRFSVSEFWNRLRHYQATQIFTMSAMHMWLLGAPPADDDRDNPARIWGPVPLAPELHEPFRERFGIDDLWFTYGQTEALMLTSTEVGRPYKPGSAGWARPGVRLAVVDDDDRVLPPGSTGELVVRPVSPHTIMDGYWDNAEASLHAFRNLWYHTGDVARLDEDGEVFFVDRRADYLRVRGENVSSFEVESTITEHPAVAEVAAFAVSAGESAEDDIMIAVIPADGATPTAEEICAHCNEHLPYFAVPRYIDIVSEFPRTPTNRVQKYQLRQRGISDTTWDRVAAGFVVTR